MNNKTFLDRIQSINPRILYLLLIIATTVPLFLSNVVIPTNTGPETQTLFANLSRLKPGSVVVIESDWTVSSRGESAGQLEVLLRILKQKDCKFVLFSAADPQAPQVARNVIRRVNSEFKDGGFKEWQDWVDLKYFPQAESFATSMANDLRKAWGSREMVDPADGVSKNVFQSPVLKSIRRLEDIKMYVIVTASGTPKVIIQRFGSPPKTPIAAMVTGVMGPEHLNYYASGQLAGLSVGLRGVVEMESMMANGINYRRDGKEPVVKSTTIPEVIPPLEGAKTYARGMQYFASLHMALFLLIFFVILGNAGLIARKLKRGA